MLGRELLIDLRRQGRIDHDGLAVVADQVGEAALAGAADLDDGGCAPGDRHLGAVPGQAPGLHAAGERAGVVATRPQLLHGGETDLAGAADGHHRRIRGDGRIGQRRRGRRP